MTTGEQRAKELGLYYFKSDNGSKLYFADDVHRVLGDGIDCSGNMINGQFHFNDPRPGIKSCNDTHTALLIGIREIKPKKKVVRWLWAEKGGYVSCKYRSEEEAQIDNRSCSRNGQLSIKLEWSRQEFDV